MKSRLEKKKQENLIVKLFKTLKKIIYAIVSMIFAILILGVLFLPGAGKDKEEDELHSHKYYNSSHKNYHSNQKSYRKRSSSSQKSYRKSSHHH